MPCSKRIMVVEDDQDIRESMRDLLDMEGFTVLTASNGKEAIELISKMSEPCLVFLDLMMPIMNGWEFLEELRHDHRALVASLPIIVLSGVADTASVDNTHVKKMIKKPVDIDSVIRVAQEYCSKSAA